MACGDCSGGEQLVAKDQGAAVVKGIDLLLPRCSFPCHFLFYIFEMHFTNCETLGSGWGIFLKSSLNGLEKHDYMGCKPGRSRGGEAFEGPR